MSSNHRIDEVDIVKGVGIICMVIGHSGSPLRDFIYLFHMAIFFIASGFLFSHRSSDSAESVGLFAFKKVKQIWVPYVVWITVFTLLHNVLLALNVYTDNAAIAEYVSGEWISVQQPLTLPQMAENIIQAVRFGGYAQLAGTFWFFRVLFLVSLGYCTVDYLLKQRFGDDTHKGQLVVSVVFLLAGYWCRLNVPGAGSTYVPQALSFYCLYHAGRAFRDAYESSGLAERLLSPSGTDRGKSLAVCLISLVILVNLGRLGTMELSQNEYHNPLFLLAGAAAGWLFLLGFAVAVKGLPIGQSLAFVGRHTIAIMSLHFLCMKVVALVIALVYGLPSFCIAAFPNLHGEWGLWWVAYSVVGVVLPLALDVLYGKAKLRLSESVGAGQEGARG